MGASAAGVACCAGGLAVMGGLQRSTDQGVGSSRRASPAGVGDPAALPMLEAQAAKLRAAIARRSRCPDASSKNDDVRAIVEHYCQVLKSIEDQIAQLTAPKASPIASMKVLEPEAQPLESFAAGNARRGRLDSCSTICSGGDDHSASPVSSGDSQSRANTLAGSSRRAERAAPDGRGGARRVGASGRGRPADTSSAPTGEACRRRSSGSSRSKRDSKVATRKDRASI